MTRFFSHLICSLSLVSFIAQAARADVLIQAETASADEFMAQVKTDDSVISLVDELEKTRPDQAHTDLFLRKFERAQQFYLSGNESEAKRAFLELTQAAHDADWRETQRQALLYSYLRLAQLSPSPGEHDTYLQQAARFAPDVAPDAQLFPPPLLKAYVQIRSRELKSATSFSLAEKFAGYDLVIVDGRRYEALTETQIQLTQGPHRVTLLSNSRPPQTQTLTSSQLSVFKSDAKPIAVGNCSEPALVGFQDLGLKTVSVFYDRNCVRAFTGTSWLKAQQSDFSQPGLATQPSDFTRALQTAAPAEVKSNHTWLWAGLGAALLASAALVYAHEHRGSDKVQPVQRQGYN
jgi:hypothetical protein